VTRQLTIEKWARRVLGDDIFTNTKERALRVAEEAIELAQALGVPVDDIHRLVGYVYARPIGDPAQEIAGTMVTLYAAAASAGVDADAAFDAEVVRIHTPEIEAKVRRRQAEKRQAMVTMEEATGSLRETAQRLFDGLNEKEQALVRSRVAKKDKS
jgi:hypothetical protein